MRAPIQSVPDVGSTTLVHGSEEQKQEHLPPMVRGETQWCQGYSEPGSGSDLASIQTRATRDGDDFVINGQKIWTSGAKTADMIFALVRTDPEAPKHRGISYLLFEMDKPGISIRPLGQMTGATQFNEVFFEDVRVPVSAAVGEINRGWYVGATHLDFERSSIGNAVAFANRLNDLIEFLKDEAEADTGRSKLKREPIYRGQLARSRDRDNGRAAVLKPDHHDAGEGGHPQHRGVGTEAVLERTPSAHLEHRAQGARAVRDAL